MDYYSGVRKEVFSKIFFKPVRILEIGCGEGGFRQNFDYEVEYWGVEPSNAANKALVSLNRVINDTYDRAAPQIPDNYFDLIICNDVIEHISNCNEFIRDVKSKLADGGLLMASIPNVRYIGNLIGLLFWKDWKYTDSGILDVTHLRFFTYKSMVRFFEENDYEIVKSIGINRFPSFSWSIKKILKNVMIIFLGGDARFLQYVFFVKKP